MKYKIFPKSERLRSEIVIDLFPLQICNYDCSYCFTSFTNVFDGENTNVTFNKEAFNVLLDSIPPDRNILFHILGGEPTLIPSILDITQRIIETKNRVGVVTNGSMLYKLKFQDDVFLEVSIHEEYIDDAYIENMVQGVINNNTCDGIEIVVNLSATYENVKVDIKRVVDRVLDLNQENVTVRLNPIICEDPSDNHEIDYDAVIDYLNIKDKVTSEDGVYILTNMMTNETKEISYLDHIHIYEKVDNSFKGCFCISNTFEIRNNFDLFNACDGSTKLGNVLENPSLLTNIASKFILCNSTHCNSGCYMDTTKAFNYDDVL